MVKQSQQQNAYISGGTASYMHDAVGTTIDVWVGTPNNEFSGADNPITASFAGVVT